MNKMIIAPDSYKGSLTAIQVCDIVEEVAHKIYPETEIVKIPIADGGEGLVDAMLIACQGEKVWVEVQDPLGRNIRAFYGILPNGMAVIEMAAASGLPLLKEEEKDVLRTTTYGTGQLILDALEHGCREFILGVGGSATNDGGAGVGAVLGIRYLKEDGQVINAGGELMQLASIDTAAIVDGLLDSDFVIACDVTNPLYGSNGAAHVYSRQKGASEHEVDLLDQGLRHLAQVVYKQTGMDLQSMEGTGAAGGIVVPLLAFASARLVRGLDVVLDAVGFDEQLEGCDLVITGEGRTDFQSSMGKVLSGVGQRSKAKGVPVIAISGALQDGYEELYDLGITAMFATTRRICTLDEAFAEAEKNLREATEDILRLIKWCWDKFGNPLYR